MIDDQGANLGPTPIEQALQMAAEAGMDLVEIAPNSVPPVAKILDYGRYKFQAQKKAAEARKKQKTVEIKEIRLRPKTSDHHLSFKIRSARRWLEAGMKVKVRVTFRAREIHYPEIGREMLDQIADEVGDVGIIEQRPNMEGYTMLMVLAPNTEKK